MSSPALEFAKISKSFSGVPVIREVSFTLEAGHVLGLVGENGAGKSTLMNLLGGNLQPDSGKMFIGGAVHAPATPLAAVRAGVAFIHQELNLFPNLTIAENIFLTEFPHIKKSPFIARREADLQTGLLLNQVGLTMAPTTPVERLSTGQRQLVEIAKALSQKARVIIFDEPTTSLSARETEILFAVIEQLRERGIAVIYISHVLNDIIRFCNDIVVLRDGAVVRKGHRTEFTIPRMISFMVGRELEQLYPTRRGAPRPELALEISGLTEPNIVREIDLTVKRGEIVGVAGLMGAGRSELARIIFGLDPYAEGEIRVQGENLTRGKPAQRIERKLAFLTEDRREDGLCLEASIADNLGLVTWREHAVGPVRWLNFKHWREAIQGIGRAVRLHDKVDLQTPVGKLSGGNQQKVVLGKWLLAHPGLLILDEPTRGVDVGAKFELYQLILDLADAGTGILLISSEIEELLGLCDQIIVMNRGAIADRIDRAKFNRERILKSALPHDEELR